MLKNGSVRLEDLNKQPCSPERGRNCGRRLNQAGVERGLSANQQRSAPPAGRKAAPDPVRCSPAVKCEAVNTRVQPADEAPRYISNLMQNLAVGILL